MSIKNLPGQKLEYYARCVFFIIGIISIVLMAGIVIFVPRAKEPETINHENAPSPIEKREHQPNVLQCYKLGGVPIFKEFDDHNYDYLVDCKLPVIHINEIEPERSK